MTIYTLNIIVGHEKTNRSFEALIKNIFGSCYGYHVLGIPYTALLVYYITPQCLALSVSLLQQYQSHNMNHF